MKETQIRFVCLIIALFFSLGASPSAEEANPPSAAALLAASQKKTYRLEDQSAALSFRMVDTDGKSSESTYTLYWKNYKGEEGINSKSLFVTHSPIKDKDKKFLVWEYVEEGKADQWIYLPELRQVRRVQPHRHHHDGELESELVIEDVRQRRIEKDIHRLRPEQDVAGEPCDVVETEIQGESLFRKTIKYLSKKNGTLRKIEYLSETGEILKTQLIDWEEVQGEWVWKRSETINARTGRKTLLELSDIKVNVGLRDDQFSERALRR